jgi:hypothetical protein
LVNIVHVVMLTNIAGGLLFSRLRLNEVDEEEEDDDIGAGNFRRAASLRVLRSASSRVTSPTNLLPATSVSGGSPFYRVGSLRAYNRSVFDFRGFEAASSSTQSPGRGRPLLRRPGGRGRAKSLPAEMSPGAEPVISMESIIAAFKGKDGVTQRSSYNCPCICFNKQCNYLDGI